MMTNERDDRELEALLVAAQPPLKPSLTDKALAAMTEAAQTHKGKPIRLRTFGPMSVAKRKLLAAGAVAALIVGLMLWMLPRRGLDSALADMARAMANVKSAHFMGVSLDRGAGGYVSVEGWVKGPQRMRTNLEGLSEEVHNGKTWTEINLRYRPVLVRINTETKSSPIPGVPGSTYLDLFNGSTQMGMLTSPDSRLISKSVTLPDGRAATVVEQTDGEERLVITIDPQTDLLISWEAYHSGKLRDKIERIEYNIKIPDSIFVAKYPKGAMLIDATKPSRTLKEQRAQFVEWEKAVKRLPGAVMIGNFVPCGKGNCDTPFHRNLMFEVLNHEGMIVVYLPDRNVYRLFGKVMVHEDGNMVDPGPIVENGEYIPPSPPIINVEQWIAERKAEEARIRAELERGRPTPEMLAKWKATGKKLATMGAKEWCQGYSLTVDNIRGCTFESANGYEIDVWYSPSRGEYYIMGKARIYGRGFDQTVEDGWIKVPGPAPRLSE
jgi:outer membrane lipoprotein-sorting protein